MDTTQEKAEVSLDIKFAYKLVVRNPDAWFVAETNQKGTPYYLVQINGRQLQADSLVKLTEQFKKYIEELQKTHAKFVQEVEKHRGVTVWL